MTVLKKKVTLYINGGDHAGEHAAQAARLLADVCGGATVIPARGFWQDDRTNTLYQEPVYLVYAFHNLPIYDLYKALRGYLYLYKQNAHQRTVAIEFDGTLLLLEKVWNDLPLKIEEALLSENGIPF